MDWLTRIHPTAKAIAALIAAINLALIWQADKVGSTVVSGITGMSIALLGMALLAQISKGDKD